MTKERFPTINEAEWRMAHGFMAGVTLLLFVIGLFVLASL